MLDIQISDCYNYYNWEIQYHNVGIRSVNGGVGCFQMLDNIKGKDILGLIGMLRKCFCFVNETLIRVYILFYNEIDLYISQQSTRRLDHDR